VQLAWHAYVGQQLVGSVPVCTAVSPAAQVGASQVPDAGHPAEGGSGTHCPRHCWLVHTPFASQAQLKSPGAQLHVTPASALGWHEDAWHCTSHRWPLGHSLSALHPAAT
jgi:hypothetical protein